VFVTQTQCITSELTSCRDDVKRLQSEAESMTSRTGHVMATVALHPLDERLREAEVALSGKMDLVDGQSATISSEPASTINADGEVDYCCIVRSTVNSEST